jgi:hypothetical protein
MILAISRKQLRNSRKRIGVPIVASPFSGLWFSLQPNYEHCVNQLPALNSFVVRDEFVPLVILSPALLLRLREAGSHAGRFIS